MKLVIHFINFVPWGLMFWCLMTAANDSCPAKKQYHLVPPDSHHVHPGRLIQEYGPITHNMCIRTCRQYLECGAYLMKWLGDSEDGLGQCQILFGVTHNHTQPYEATALQSLYSKFKMCVTPCVQSLWRLVLWTQVSTRIQILSNVVMLGEMYLHETHFTFKKSKTVCYVFNNKTYCQVFSKL